MNETSEQVSSNLNIVEGADQPLRGDDLHGRVMSALGRGARLIRVLNGRHLAVEYMDGSGVRHVFLCAAVTFLGGTGNHPKYKKRIQLKTWYKSVYQEISSETVQVHFLGVYHYEDNVVFVDFDAPSFVQNKMHNSSAFVYTNDIFRAMKDGRAHRIGFNGHALTTVKNIKFREYVDGLSRKELSAEPWRDKPLFMFFDGFNQGFPFSKWITGESAIRRMWEAGCRNWKQTEWAGWYLEHLFASYVGDMDSGYVRYTHAMTQPPQDALDFDIWFPEHRFYGDLKASDIEKKESPGNDQEALLDAISRFDRFWYVIYEHRTEKDDRHGGAFRRFRQDFIVSVEGVKAVPAAIDIGGGRKHRVLKNRICFERMEILELNRANMGGLLKTFNQGRQASGAEREKKFNIDKSQIENFQVYHFPVSGQDEFRLTSA